MTRCATLRRCDEDKAVFLYPYLPLSNVIFNHTINKAQSKFSHTNFSASFDLWNRSYEHIMYLFMQIFYINRSIHSSSCASRIFKHTSSSITYVMIYLLRIPSIIFSHSLCFLSPLKINSRNRFTSLPMIDRQIVYRDDLLA